MSSQVFSANVETAILAGIFQADEQKLTVDATRSGLSVKLAAIKTV